MVMMVSKKPHSYWRHLEDYHRISMDTYTPRICAHSILSSPHMMHLFNVKADSHKEGNNHIFKKRRTSSDMPDEAKLFEEQEDPQTQVPLT